MRRFLASALAAGILATPFSAFAFPFGGQAFIYRDCPINGTKQVELSGPRGGSYVWTGSTRTYKFGPPSHTGQWILGLAGIPYFCIFSIFPLTVYPGIAITMMGSSQ